MKSAWPTTTNVASALAGMGITAVSGYSTADYLAASIQEWEMAVGVSPWFVDGTVTTTSTSRTVTPYGQGTVHIPPCAVVETVVLGGVTLTEDEDYWLRPDSASDQYRPITHIEFSTRVTGNNAALVITGKWGYQTSIFESVYQLILDMTVAKVLESAQMKAVLAQGMAASGPVTEVRQENITIKYDSSAGRSFVAASKARFGELASLYKVRGF